MTVLIVDDIATNRKVLRGVLEAGGMTVFEAADGGEALGVLEREQIDGIISDLHDSDWFEYAGHITTVGLQTKWAGQDVKGCSALNSFCSRA